MKTHFSTVTPHIFVLAVSTGRKCLQRSAAEHRVCTRHRLAAAGRSAGVPAPAACSVAVELADFSESGSAAHGLRQSEPDPEGLGSLPPFPRPECNSSSATALPQQALPGQCHQCPEMQLKERWAFWDQTGMPGTFRCL